MMCLNKDDAFCQACADAAPSSPSEDFCETSSTEQNDPDAELEALSKRIVEIYKRENLAARHSDFDAWRDASAEWNDLFAQILGLPIHGLTGLRAKAAALHTCEGRIALDAETLQLLFGSPGDQMAKEIFKFVFGS